MQQRHATTLMIAAAWGAASLIALERFYPQLSLITLLILLGSLGTFHGALDVLLIARYFERRLWRLGFAVFYLLATVLTAGVLGSQPAAALLLLLALSVWHFGESFEAEQAASKLQRALERCVRGGAPVFLPALLAAPALKALVLVAVSGDQAKSDWVWAVWHSAAVVWLCALGVWLLVCMALLAQRHFKPRMRQGFIEIAVLTALYIVASPLMAFALFFGLYHATGHIRRVMFLVDAAQRARLWRDPRLLCAVVLSLILGAWLVLTMHRFLTSAAVPDAALRMMILALTAVSVPHVLLVTCAAGVLRGSHETS
jgi:beta-carotene 15,15'-dioxygenase